jgi:phage head maturation protease
MIEIRAADESPEDEIRCAIEVREVEGRTSPGRLVGTLMTYGEEHRNRPEVFEAGSLKWGTDGVVLRRQHNRQSPIMRVMPEVRGDKIVIDQDLPDTAAGWDAATEIRAGLFRGLSVEFKAAGQMFSGGKRRIRSAMLTGAGLVDRPAYAQSAVEVRDEGEKVVSERSVAWI